MTAGYPNRADTVPLLLALQEGGADVVELGVPFTDPQADGTTIQKASQVIEDVDSVLLEADADHPHYVHDPVFLTDCSSQ